MKAINAWDADDLLASPETDIIEHLIDEYGAQAPVVHRDRMQRLPSSDHISTVDDFMGRREIRQTEITFLVPCEGDLDLMRYRPGAYTSLLSGQTAKIVGSEIEVIWRGKTSDPAVVLHKINDELDIIEKNLDSARSEIAGHNEFLRKTVSERVSLRKRKILADRELEAALGIPVRQHDGPPAFSVPVSRRQVMPRRHPVAAQPFQPEWELLEKDYEEAIRVITHSRNALERTPGTIAKLGEEDIRNLLLVSLNSTFMGASGGELFNGDGKTDILVRVEDRNVFIGECKIWDGPKVVGDALTQLLKYHVWRDSKGALLLFIRRGDATSTIRKAIQKIEEHPNHKRTLDARPSDGRYDFVIRANDDAEREIHLAFLPFILPLKQD
ncbi:hypothetical protein C9F11_47165 (plasmid) [Streptomyces sp. YIM 121038]|nr:hypothetical protein C9F11_00015 [Streptomyces sp. YIM 121038]QCX82113.1 hypothetical protein C9F11_42665 [Streptomyces sp. YIM 121038]QCX82118.1 hypothetical protein C9F11_42690 [Streptomyces sp. YIM 121038]QCX82980.1 hypothetical protein C9F11_47165 [Streptomyces sp. YIM 121038]